VLCAGFAPAVRGDDDPKAIIAKSIKAASLPTDKAGVKMTWKEKGAFSGGGFSLPYTSDYAFQAPDKFHFDMQGEFGGMKIAIVLAANGGKAWESGFGKTEEVTGEKLEYVQGMVYQLWVTSLAPLLQDKDFKLTAAKGKDVKMKPTVGVAVEREKRPTITLYFDKESGLLVKTEMLVKDEFQKWKEVLDESYFDGYKDANGKKFFTKLKVVRDGKTMIEAELSDAKSPEKLDPKLFEKP
jgi:hypothetical protein